MARKPVAQEKRVLVPGLVISVPADAEYGQRDHYAEKLGDIVENDVGGGGHYEVKITGEQYDDQDRQGRECKDSGQYSAGR